MQALVVIDDPVLCGWVTDYLSEQGFFVTCASKDRDPLERILDTQPRLVVLDLTVPRLQGFATLLKIRQHPQTAKLPLLVLTSPEQLASVYKGWQAGLDWFLLEPVTVDDLHHALEQILDARDEKTLSTSASLQGPVATPQAAWGSSASESTESTAAEPKLSVLAVDDDKDVARLVAAFLESEGHSVSIAFDAAAALSRIRAHRPDLLVLDIEMPDMDGLELLRHLRADPTTATLPVVLLTGRDEISDLFNGWEAGAGMYITKPFEKQELLDAISTVLHPHAVTA